MQVESRAMKRFQQHLGEFTALWVKPLSIKHITLDSCLLCQVSQLYVMADSIRGRWEECLVIG